MIERFIAKAEQGDHLSFDEASEAVEQIMRGAASEAQMAKWLTALHIKGESVDEVAGAALAMRRNMTPIRTARRDFIDTCGTGGDASGTFNISTAAAIVTAAAGVPVAKHGNRGMTSRTGSADALAALGVNINADAACVERCLDEIGICFCFAPLLHQSMKHVSAVRKSLPFSTIFNLLGPLSNPAGAPFQLLGVGRAPLRPLLAGALLKLGVRRALVVRGDDGLDEVSLFAATGATLVQHGELRDFAWTPEDFGLTRGDRQALLVEGPLQSAAIIRDLLAGKQGPARDIVVLNAAAALWVARPEAGDDSPLHCATQAAAAIDSGAAAQLLAELVKRTCE